MKCSKIKITYFLLGFVLLWGGGLHAATIHVYIHAVGNADGSDWDNAYTTIQDGIDNASPGDEVWVVAWIFNESITLKSGVSLYGGFSQFDDQLSDRNLRYKTIIDGTGLNSSVVTMSEITDSKIDGFTIRGGNVNSLNSPDPEGGGFRILSADQSNEISHCSVVGNSGDEGGGMYIYDSSPIITNTIIGGNKGFNAGAGVAVYDSDVTFDSCHFSGNESSIGSAFFTLLMMGYCL